MALRPGEGPPVPGQPGNNNRPQRPWLRIGLLLLAIAVYVLLLVSPFIRQVSGPPKLTIPYSLLRTQVADDNVKDITIQGQDANGTLKPAISYNGSPSNTLVSSVIPANDTSDPSIYTLLVDHHVNVTIQQDSGGLGGILL